MTSTLALGPGEDLAQLVAPRSGAPVAVGLGDDLAAAGDSRTSTRTTTATATMNPPARRKARFHVAGSCGFQVAMTVPLMSEAHERAERRR